MAKSPHNWHLDANGVEVAKGQGEGVPDNSKEVTRTSSVINRAYVKRWALDYASTNRSQPFTRVSDDFLNAVEANTKAFIRDRINRAPSRGVTLK